MGIVYPSTRYHKVLPPKKVLDREHDVELKKLGYDRHAVIFSKDIKDDASGEGLPESAPAGGRRRGRGQA